MPLTLSTSELSELQLALSLLLSPMEYERMSDWRRDCRATFQRLLGIDPGIFGLFLEEENSEQDRELDAAIVGWLDGRSGPDDFPPAPPHTHVDPEESRTLSERRTALLRLLLPAFRAGIQICRTLGVYRERWRQVLDSLGRAALVASPRSDGAHQTPALRALLDQEPEQTAVLLEITAVADALAMPGGSADGTGQGAPLPMVRDVVTARARYQLRGAQLTTESERPTMVVTVDRLNPMPPSDGQLHARFGLTPRESEVARQLAVGHTNAELSAALGISRHTGERHTERVLGKLGLHSRAAVAAALGAA